MKICLRILLLLPEKTAFMASDVNPRQRKECNEMYKAQDRFISRLYQGDHLAQAYLYALNEVSGSKLITAPRNRS